MKPQSTDYLYQSWYALKDGVEKLRLNLIAKVQEQCMATKSTKDERKSMKVLEEEYFAKMEKEKEELAKALTHKLKAKTSCKGKTNKNTVVDSEEAEENVEKKKAPKRKEKQNAKESKRAKIMNLVKELDSSSDTENEEQDE